MKNPTISACMIVKNEEQLLPGCLKSVKHYVDEIIVVDTGSTDKTVSIAESFGAHVYHHPWEHNFSKHRNQSFSYAKGDWILYIDADEELLPKSGDALREAILADEDVDAIGVVLECIFNQGGSKAYVNSIRVFRNHRGLRYEGRVHNYIVGVKKAIYAPIHIFHHGYNLNKKTMNQKFKRTTELLKKDIEEEPTNPRPHHYLAASYLSENMFKEATEEAMAAISLYEKRNVQSHNYLWSIYNAASAYFHMGEIEKAERLARKGIDVFPNHIDSHYLLALIAYGKKNRKKFIYHMRRYMEAKDSFEKNPTEFGELVHNTIGSEWILYLFKGFNLFNDGYKDRAQEEFEKSLEVCPDRFLYHTKLGYFFEKSENLSQAEEQYLIVLEMVPKDTKTIYALSEIYEKLGKIKDQFSWLEKLVKIVPNLPNDRFNIGLAYMKLGKLDHALSLFRYVQVLEPENQRAKINEAICLRYMGKYKESIQLLEKVTPSENLEQLTVVSNLAHCYYESGQTILSIEFFQQMAEMEPGALEPLVYLSRLFLEHKEIEPCVVLCGKLLSLLDIQENRMLNSLEELGELYSKAGNRLTSSLNNQDLSRICFEISNILGYHSPKIMPEMVRSFV